MVVDDTDPREELDYSPSSGSGDGQERAASEQAPVENINPDKQLGFNPADAPPETRGKYESLASTDRRLYRDDNHTERSRKFRDIATFCDELDCTDRQRDRALLLLYETNLNEYGNPPLEVASLALIVIACNEDNRFVRHLDSRDDVDNSDIVEQYHDLLDSLGVTDDMIREMIGRFKSSL